MEWKVAACAFARRVTLAEARASDGSASSDRRGRGHEEEEAAEEEEQDEQVDDKAVGSFAHRSTALRPRLQPGVVAGVVLGGAVVWGGAAALRPPSVSAASPVSTIRNYSTRDIVAYKLQKVFGLPLFGKILCLFLVTIPVVAIGGLAYKVVGPDEGQEEESWKDVMTQSFFILNDIPGADATTDVKVERAVVSQTIVFVGMFVFAAIIGIISDEIASKVEEVKTGNSKVVETDHTVVVNWNRQLIPLLRQMAVAKAERAGTFDKPVVLLADVDKETMDEDLEEALEGQPPLEVVTRRGSSFNAEDLAKVNAFAARRVIILHPHSEVEEGPADGSGEEDAEVQFQQWQREEANKATTVLTLRSDTSRGNPDLVVQMPHRIPVARDLVGHALKITRRQQELDGTVDPYEAHVQVSGSENIGKVCAFAAFQPGISKVYEALLQQSLDKPEFYISPAPQLAGMTFGEAWRMLPHATLCGISHADGHLELAPKDNTIIAADDEIVLLAESSVVKISQPNLKSIPLAESETRFMHRLKYQTTKRPVNLLFAGFSEETTIAIELATEMAPAGSTITVLADEIPPVGMRALRSTGKCKMKVIKGVPTSHRDLAAARVQDMDTIIVMPSHGSDELAGADSSVLATVLQTDAICTEVAAHKRGRGVTRAPHIVAKLNTESAREVLERLSVGGRAPDVIMSDDMVAGVLLQVSANPKLARLFGDMLETEGHEVYMREGDAYGLDGRAGVSWGTVCERARVRNELALGIMRAGGDVVLSPSKADEIVIKEGDRIIVLAEDYA